MPILQEAILKASPQRVYEALTESHQFSALSAAPATLSKDEGGTFSCFGGVISGRIVELVPNHRIVQAWRAKLWPEGLYSLVKFELTAKGSETLLVLEHSAYPEQQREHLARGWQANYMAPLARYLAK